MEVVNVVGGEPVVVNGEVVCVVVVVGDVEVSYTATYHVPYSVVHTVENLRNKEEDTTNLPVPTRMEEPVMPTELFISHRRSECPMAFTDCGNRTRVNNVVKVADLQGIALMVATNKRLSIPERKGPTRDPRRGGDDRPVKSSPPRPQAGSRPPQTFS